MNMLQSFRNSDGTPSPHTNLKISVYPVPTWRNCFYGFIVIVRNVMNNAFTVI